MKKKKKLGRPPKVKTADSVIPPIRVTPNQLKAYKAASKIEGQTFSAWVRGVLDKSSKQSLAKAPKPENKPK